MFRNVAGFYLKTLYGHQIPVTGQDDFLALHTKSLRESSKAISSGVYLVNVFPSSKSSSALWFGVIIPFLQSVTSPSG